MKTFLLLLALLLGGPASAQLINVVPLSKTGSLPTAGTCAGFALTGASNDSFGRVTYTSATTCSINFGTQWGAAPFCVVTPGTAASTLFITTSTSQLAVTFGTAQTAFFYACFGS